MPSALEFRFTDASGETPRTIEVRSVTINDNYVNTTNFLSSDSLTNGQTSVVDISNSVFLFDESEPSSVTFTTGATKKFTAGIDFHNNYNGTADEAFDMLAGNDYAYTGSGNDTISDGADILVGGVGADKLTGGSGAGTDNLIILHAPTIYFTTGIINELETLTGLDGDQDVMYIIEQALKFTAIDLQGGNDASRISITGDVDVTTL